MLPRTHSLTGSSQHTHRVSARAHACSVPSTRNPLPSCPDPRRQRKALMAQPFLPHRETSVFPGPDHALFLSLSLSSPSMAMTGSLKPLVLACAAGKANPCACPNPHRTRKGTARLGMGWDNGPGRHFKIKKESSGLSFPRQGMEDSAQPPIWRHAPGREDRSREEHPLPLRVVYF
ncbi:uncharacterized protein K489DRAFT_34802 [Dissoconium aciculare CBS 342.82]|uniref:Uncharacterized protein n=1 Tax=Dissoconium aciculare CBS 342.82 TaxID=1314786 RepID=A0A6J3M0S3_9PEZI|nr:uncharacterized protein K489DRAFT_34802 [Dissoconium aciculare CBS 342.82]KAF1820507.1 hypothetical protein K489DRAFT_34802 [Dissoconium aciculare CBS 342.82]